MASSADDPGASALLERCKDRGFTPGVRDVGPLLDLAAADRKREKAVVTALARGDAGVAERLHERVLTDDASARALCLRILARLHERTPVDGWVGTVGAALDDEDPRVVRAAARAVSKLETGTEGLEARLLEIAADAELPERRAAVDALARTGSMTARTALHAMKTDDPDLARRVGEALVMLDRRQRRAEPSVVELTRPMTRPLRLVFRCRPGMAWAVAAQIAAAPRVGLDGDTSIKSEPTEVSLITACSLGDCYGIRSNLDVGFAFDLIAGGDLVERIVGTLSRPDLHKALQAWTRGPLRFRLALAGPGTRRSTIWAVARKLAELKSPLLNDSRAASWTLEVDPDRARIVAFPRGVDDRFAYRVRDVPAASHPTLAATLAWVADPQAGETVWDPFCGSGTELFECSRRAEGLRLIGTDGSGEAIAAAEANAAASDVRCAGLEFHHADAFVGPPGARPGSVDLVVTNPPMGRRASTEGGLHEFFTRFVGVARTWLRPEGRIVWVSPAPDATAKAASDIGLDVEDLGWIDLRGFRVKLQRLR